MSAAHAHRSAPRRRMIEAALALALAGLFALAGSPLRASEDEPPRARASLLPLAQPLWSDLSARQREILAPLEQQWNALPSTSKRSWVTLANRVPRMKEADRDKALERIREFASLTPEQRRQARNNYRLTQGMDQDERAATWEQYRQMTPEQRAVLRASGWTSNTAAKHAGSPTGLAKEAARPLSTIIQPAIKRSTLQPTPPGY